MMLSRFSDFKNTENVNPLDLVETLEYKDLVLGAIDVANSWSYELIHTQTFIGHKDCDFLKVESENICLVFYSETVDKYLYIFLQEPFELHPTINFFTGHFVTKKDLKKRIKSYPKRGRSFMAKNIEGLKTLFE